MSWTVRPRVIAAATAFWLAVGPNAPAVPISIEGLRATVARLTDPALAGRRSGTEGARAAAEYLYGEFDAMGIQTRFQDLDPRRRNVVARLGDAREHILIGAHYDGQGGANPGASDNAAGVAVMLELARDLRTADSDVSFVFVAFDDEEQGLNGARFYAANPVYPLADLRAAVILDTMGRSFIDLEEWSLLVLGTEMSPELAGIVADEAGRAVRLGTDLIGARSDFAPFAARRVPYLFFSNATHVDYHGPGDTADQIRYERLRDDGETIADVVTAIGALRDRPVYSDTPVYPPDEADNLISIMDRIEAGRPDLADAYRPLFDDARARLSDAPSRLSLRVATEALLAAATPRFASFSLLTMLGPLYESEGRTEAALAAYRQALRLAADPAVRDLIEMRIRSLER